MKPSRPLATLFHPFESGAIATPAQGRFLFLGAEPGFRLSEGFAADLHLVQGFRPHFRALEAAGNRISALPEGSGYDGALVLAGRHRGQNEDWIAEAVERVLPGGLILLAGSNEDGIGSLRKRVNKLVGTDDSLPKHHGVAFWFRRPDDASFVSALRPQPVLVEDRFATAPGMFSHDRVDLGSTLLAECLPETGKGSAADFGAGWGYLAGMLAERTTGLASIDLYEADYASLEAAKSNLAELPKPPAFNFFWHDLVGEAVERKYDLVVMNPPFHQGRAAEPGIGQAMIGKAASALKPGGRLLMVANRGLPYAQTLQAAFKKVEELRDEDGFRVFSAIR
ncbi:MAG: class I SAM-dependent methyltransferase [Mesorhizobium sp.]|nr:class I SAM-dependent methyltransferase [Mesorhizobium sp.]MBL8576783.1 class I SAM-dependent methyltransferase [Mesorhizobium sp.]